jgi:hypothetical protein
MPTPTLSPRLPGPTAMSPPDDGKSKNEIPSLATILAKVPVKGITFSSPLRRHNTHAAKQDQLDALLKNSYNKGKLIARGDVSSAFENSPIPKPKAPKTQVDIDYSTAPNDQLMSELLTTCDNSLNDKIDFQPLPRIMALRQHQVTQPINQSSLTTPSKQL